VDGEAEHLTVPIEGCRGSFGLPIAENVGCHVGRLFRKQKYQIIINAMGENMAVEAVSSEPVSDFRLNLRVL